MLNRQITLNTRPLLHISLSCLLLLLNACSDAPTRRDNQQATRPAVTPKPASPPQTGSYSGVFPKPAALEPAVTFWKKTYGVWSRSEVAFHDDRHLDLIYEVMLLPGNVGEGLTQEQKDLVSARREYWKNQVSQVAAKLRYGATLNASDRQLIAKVENIGQPLSILDDASDRVRSQRGTRERFKRGLEISGRYNRKFRQIFHDAGLPEDLAYLPHVESSFQLTAKSSAGAVGLWQFTRAAAKTFIPGNGGGADLRLDPYASAIGASRYLNSAYGKLGDWPAAITSYNHGIGGMKRAQNQMGPNFVRIVENYDGPAFGFASRNYYVQFLAAREIASRPELYFTEGVSYEPALDQQQYLATE